MEALKLWRWTVGSTKYLKIKLFAGLLTSSVFACGIGVVLLLVGLPYSYYQEIKECELMTGRATTECLPLSPYEVAEALCSILIPFLLICAVPLWLESRKRWKIVRTMQPLYCADLNRLPLEVSLVRASTEPVEQQRAVLLRPASESDTTSADQLLRSASGAEKC